MTDKLREAAQQAVPQHLADDERVAALCDLSYVAGMKAGWNFCISDDSDGFERRQNSVGEAIRILKSHRAPTPSAQQDAQAVPQGWQPIETAPKDGTVIDLWHEEFGREADCYWGLPHHCCGEMGSLCDSDWHSLEPGWVGTFNEIMSPANAYTHWMPLPPAPDADPTPPAQRVMLTDEEIDAEIQIHIDPIATYRRLHNFARAIIEAYKEKNGLK